MKYIPVLLTIVFFVSGVSAFQANGPGVLVATVPSAVNPSTSGPSTDDSTPVKKIGNIELPPEKSRPMTIPKLGTSSPVIDGKVDEEIWKQAAVFKDFYQTSPGDNIAASKPTEVLMMYDEKFLYIAFKCWDEKDKIRATVASRDNVFGEDNVRMWIDTFNDQRRAYVFGFNPFGIQQDGIYTEGKGADFSVDIVMESKGVIEDWGWSVEIKIPFKSLRYSAGKGKLWGFNAARNIDRFNDEFDQWLPDDRNATGFLVKHGKITGLDEIKYERTIEVVPSITLAQTSLRKRTIPNSGFAPFGPFEPIFNPIGLTDPGKFTHDPIQQEIGVNFKYTMSPSVTIDAAFNPDYAEIEADAPVVSANQRFPIFFAEKRPFFLEGKEIFETSMQPFYTRTIIDPDIAVKVSGKKGKTTYGFLGASDNAPGNYSEDERGELLLCQERRQLALILRLVPGPCSAIEEFVDKNASFGILRVKRDVGKESSIGFIGTARVFPKNRNFLGGIDGTLKLNPQTVMVFQVLETYSKKPFYDPDRNQVDYRVGNGFGYFWSLDYTTDQHGWYAEAVGRTKDYRADAGFTRRVDSNSFFFINRFSTKSNATAKLIRTNWNQFARYNVDWKGRAQGGSIGSGLNLSLQGSTFISTEAGMDYEKIYEEEFGPKRDPLTGLGGAFFGDPTRSDWHPYFSFNINKTVNKKLFVYGFIGSIIGAFDYDFGAGNKFPRASPAFRSYIEGPDYAEYIRQLYLFQANPIGTKPEPTPPGLDPGRGWQFDTNVGFEYKPIDPLRISLDYTKSRLTRSDTGLEAFDTNLFIFRSTYQFTRFTYIRARWDYDSLRSNFSGQLLFGWNPNPGTAFYVGYNDNFNYNGFSPYTNQSEPGFERNGRTFFIRASYLFRKSF